MPFLLVEILNFQGSAHLRGVGSLSYKEMSEVIGEDKARALYAELYKQPFHKKIYQYQQKKSIKVAILKSMFMN